MMNFPELLPDQLFHPNAKDARTDWWRSLIERTRAWLLTDGDICEWMNDFLAVRMELLRGAWEALIPSSCQQNADYIVFGSGARSEDLLFSDLDHGILLQENASAEDLQPHLYPFLRVMNELGCPPCQGFVMSTNPRWIGSAAKWGERIHTYFELPNWEHVRYLFMMADTRPLQHQLPAWTALRQQVLQGIQQSPFICWEMAHLGIYRTVALGAFGRIKSLREDQRDILSIKDGLLNPLIHSLRLLAIANRCTCLTSLDRSRFLNEQGILQDHWRDRIEAALKFGWKLRLKARVSELASDRLATDFIDLAILSKAEREELTQHLETAKHLERWTHRKFRKPR